MCPLARLWRKPIMIGLQLQCTTGGAAVPFAVPSRAGCIVPGAHLYRNNFRQTARLENRMRWCINIIAADSNRDANSCLPQCSSLCEAAPRQNRAAAATDSKYGSVLVPSEQYGVQQALSICRWWAIRRKYKTAVDHAKPAPMRL